MALRMLKPRLATIDTSIARPLPPPEKVRADHYGTPEHKAWAKEVVRRANGMCQRKGCGRTGVRLFANHKRALKDGGAPFDLNNGEGICGSCHSTETWREKREREGR